MINVTTDKHIKHGQRFQVFILFLFLSQLRKAFIFFLPFPVDFVKNVSPRVLAKVKFELIFYINVILNFLVTLSLYDTR